MTASSSFSCTEDVYNIYNCTHCTQLNCYNHAVANEIFNGLIGVASSILSYPLAMLLLKWSTSYRQQFTILENARLYYHNVWHSRELQNLQVDSSQYYIFSLRRLRNCQLLWASYVCKIWHFVSTLNAVIQPISMLWYWISHNFHCLSLTCMFCKHHELLYFVIPCFTEISPVLMPFSMRHFGNRLAVSLS